jgi:flagellin
MSTVINTNLASLYAQNNLSNAQNNLATSVMRLSSGLRINSAKDDAAGLAISQNMQSQINGVNQSVKNLNDATNLMQVADTSLATIQDMLLRMKQLATQGFDGSLSSNQRSNIVDELQQLNSEINNTAVRTQFNGNSLIANQSGRTAGKAVGSTSGTVTISGINALGAKAQVYTMSIPTAGTVQLTGADGTGQQIALTAAIGVQTLDFDRLGIRLDVTKTGADDEVSATDLVAAGGATMTISATNTGTGSYIDFQSGPDSSYYIRYTAINVSTDSSTTGASSKMHNLGTQITANTATGSPSSTPGLTYLKAQYNANATIENDTWSQAFLKTSAFIDTAIDNISRERSIIGAQINRISYVSTNLQAQSTNLQSSKSAIMDTDFAAETAKLTKGQIMQQAATAMLAQANQMPNVVLSVLK